MAGRGVGDHVAGLGGDRAVFGPLVGEGEDVVVGVGGGGHAVEVVAGLGVLRLDVDRGGLGHGVDDDEVCRSQIALAIVGVVGRDLDLDGVALGRVAGIEGLSGGDQRGLATNGGDVPAVGVGLVDVARVCRIEPAGGLDREGLGGVRRIGDDGNEVDARRTGLEHVESEGVLGGSAVGVLDGHDDEVITGGERGLTGVLTGGGGVAFAHIAIDGGVDRDQEVVSGLFVVVDEGLEDNAGAGDLGSAFCRDGDLDGRRGVLDDVDRHRGGGGVQPGVGDGDLDGVLTELLIRPRAGGVAIGGHDIGKTDRLISTHPLMGQLREICVVKGLDLGLEKDGLTSVKNRSTRWLLDSNRRRIVKNIEGFVLTGNAEKADSYQDRSSGATHTASTCRAGSGDLSRSFPHWRNDRITR